MREVVEDPEQARERGERGRAAVAERQSLERAAAFVADRVPELERIAHERATARDARGRAWRQFLAERPEPLLGRALALGTRRPPLAASCCCGCCAHTSSASASSRRSVGRDRRPRALARPARGRGCASCRKLARRDQRRLRRARRRALPEPYTAEAAEAGQDSPYASFEDVFRGPGGARARAARALRRAAARPRAGARRRLRARRAARAAPEARHRGARRGHRRGHGRRARAPRPGGRARRRDRLPRPAGAGEPRRGRSRST